MESLTLKLPTAFPTRSEKRGAIKKLPLLAADIAVCAASTFASYAYYNDNGKFVTGIADPAFVNTCFRAAALLIMVAIWLILTIENGLRGRYGFMIFAISFWLVPLIAGLCLSTLDTTAVTGDFAIASFEYRAVRDPVITQSVSFAVDFGSRILRVSRVYLICAFRASAFNCGLHYRLQRRRCTAAARAISSKEKSYEKLTLLFCCCFLSVFDAAGFSADYAENPGYSRILPKKLSSITARKSLRASARVSIISSARICTTYSGI